MLPAARSSAGPKPYALWGPRLHLAGGAPDRKGSHSPPSGVGCSATWRSHCWPRLSWDRSGTPGTWCQVFIEREHNGVGRRGLTGHPLPAYVWALPAGTPRLTGHVFTELLVFPHDRCNLIALTLHPGTEKPRGRHGQALAPVPTFEQPQGSAQGRWPASRAGSWASRFSHVNARLSWALGVTVAAPWARGRVAPTTIQPTSSRQAHPSEVPPRSVPSKPPSAEC